MTVAPKAAHGTVIKYHNGSTFVTIDGVQNGPNGPGFAPQFISTRHHGSEHTIVKVSTIEKTPVTFDILFDSADAAHAALRAAAAAGTRTQFEETLQDTGAEVYTYYGYVTFNVSSAVEGFVIASITITIDGDITVA